MARPEAKNVEYFPCYCADGKVLYILERRWGNNGYAFFYKLWKRLGNADYHCIDLRQTDSWEYFRAKMGVSDAETQEIMDKLAEMGVIDPDLWAFKIVWSDSFVESVRDVWIKRKQLIPQKPALPEQKPALPEQKPKVPWVSGIDNPQSKVKERKVNKNILCVFTEEFEAFWKAYPKHTSKKQAFLEWEKATAKPSLSVILSAIENQKRAKATAMDTGQFTPEWPDPERWIKKARWDDDPESLIGGGKGGNGGNGTKTGGLLKI